MASTVIKPKPWYEGDPSDVLLKFLPSRVKNAEIDAFSIKRQVKDIIEHRLYEKVGFATFENYALEVLDKPIEWFERVEALTGQLGKEMAQVSARNRVQAAAARTEPDKVLPSDGSVNQWNMGRQFVDPPQRDKAASAGVGIVTQRKLDAIARKAPDLLDKVRRGELSAHAAAIAAGIIREKTRVEKLKTLWNAATPEERAEFTGWAACNP